MDPGHGAAEEEAEESEEGDVNPEERKIKKRIQSKEDQVSKEISVPAAAEEILIQETEENKAKRAKKTPLQ